MELVGKVEVLKSSYPKWKGIGESGNEKGERLGKRNVFRTFLLYVSKPWDRWI